MTVPVRARLSALFARATCRQRIYSKVFDKQDIDGTPQGSVWAMGLFNRKAGRYTLYNCSYINGVYKKDAVRQTLIPADAREAVGEVEMKMTKSPLFHEAKGQPFSHSGLPAGYKLPVNLSLDASRR